MEVVEKTPTMLEFAKEYRKKRFSIIPLVAKDKRPSIPSWELYQKVQAEKEEIDSWFSNRAENTNNIAIVTGKVSRIFAFDIDGEQARNHFERIVGDLGDEEIRTAIENTMLIKTGSGNTNIIIGFRPEEYVIENELLKNSVLWCGNGVVAAMLTMRNTMKSGSKEKADIL
jgi:Bifunctional DNA primase/polymerase, N-terminal